ncbi:phage head closure protein [Serratia fonticola]|uniref:phage head closure protein n=1 Tax=Serratia fonticola TaxID=47917 RepID=UPI0027F90626|nr:phage head closure protein [Serratia fonticola]MDQ7209875.1 phage head closure protein [Serratia fonticola]HBE9079245.1 phage head closure protein [Serratia fonticola]HBE9091629.1 phage head closure protein [Serratia fonticola]HBE9151018.1 phage head closure protein [Serratia fonticola]
MKAGQMRHRITIQNFTTIELPSGSEKEVWFDVATVWAEVKAISGRELLASGAEMSEITLRVWLRYRADVGSASRILWQQKGDRQLAYSIVSAIPDPKASRLELLCKGGVTP